MSVQNIFLLVILLVSVDIVTLDIIFHTKCAKKAKFKLFRNKQYCLSCITTNNIIRYNPFFL